MKTLKKTKKSTTKTKTSKYQKGGLVGGQVKLDKNNNNKLDSSDFKMLRGSKK